MNQTELTTAIAAAAERIGPHVFQTPLFPSLPLAELNGGEVLLKLESEQITGSFKARGALNKVLVLDAQSRKKGVITASTGNHGLGFANALSVTGDKGTIFLPETAAESKVAALRRYGVELRFFGKGSLETELHAKAEAEKLGQTWVSPYNDYDVIAGQGTIAVEIGEQTDHVDAVLACVGGGGMISGVATWIKHRFPQAKVIGCLPDRSPEMYLSVEKGEIVTIEPVDTLSDGSAGGLEPDAVTFRICQQLLDGFLLVSEEEIAEAIVWMAEHHHKIIEGAAAVPLAAFKKNADQFKGQRVAIVICGANITHSKFKSLL